MSSDPFCGPPRQLTDNRHLNLFSTEVHDGDSRRAWVFASRKKAPLSGPLKPDAVAIIAVVNGPDESRLLVIREFRAPLGRYQLALPAGLIDEGETPATAAVRELFEETGLTLAKILHTSPPIASSAGLTDETVCLVYGEATGELSKANLDTHEKIDARLLSFSELESLLSQSTNDVLSVRLYSAAIGFLTAGKICLPPTKDSVTTLYRPVGPKELELIRASGFRSFPPRLPEQPIFYPVLNEAYAIQIARDWNVPSSGAGFVTRFKVATEFLSKYQAQTVGSKVHAELWVPALELPEFNRNIIGEIEITAEFKRATPP